MDGVSILLTLTFLLIIAFIGLLKAKTLFGIIGSFLLLTLISYMTIYLFNA